VWLPDGRNFGEAMIADGFAHEYTYDLPYAYLGSFKAAQDAAIANQAGLWSPSTCAGDTTLPADSPTVDAAASETSQPALVHLPVEPAPAPAPVTPAYGGRYDPFGPDRDCGDFRTHASVQLEHWASEFQKVWIAGKDPALVAPGAQRVLHQQPPDGAA
jgi:hypothetical protein